MDVNDQELALLAALSDGLPITSRPYLDLGAPLDLSEEQVIADLKSLNDRGIITRFGVIVRHRDLGFKANGMCVWDIPDDKLMDIGKKFGAYDFVTLCYQRPRRLPDWPYNLFCMIHGREKDTVREQTNKMVAECGLEDVARDILFSTKCYKQCGAKYGARFEAARKAG